MSRILFYLKDCLMSIFTLQIEMRAVYCHRVNVSVPDPTAHFSEIRESNIAAHEDDLWTDLVLVSQVHQLCLHCSSQTA